jgi:hypothetical protein
MACRSSTTTFRRDTATEKVPGPRELLSKGYAFLKNPIGMATHAQFHLPVPRSRIAATPARPQRVPENRFEVSVGDDWRGVWQTRPPC